MKDTACKNRITSNIWDNMQRTYLNFWFSFIDTINRCEFCYSNSVVASYDAAVEFCANRNSILAILKRNPMRRLVKTQVLSPYFDFLIGFNRFVNNSWLWIDGDSDIRQKARMRKFMTLFCMRIQSDHANGSLQIPNSNSANSCCKKSVQQRMKTKK